MNAKLTIQGYEETAVTGTAPRNIAEAIVAVMKEVGYVQKKGNNKDQGYKFVAVGDLLAKLQPAMARAGLFTIQQPEGEWVFLANNALLRIDYHIWLHHISGEKWPEPIRQTGIARWMSKSDGVDDKAVNKCATTANKYCLLNLFKIPTGELADPDEDGDKRLGDIDEGDAAGRRDVPNDGKSDGRIAAEDFTREALTSLTEIGNKEAYFDWENQHRDTIAKLHRYGHTDLHTDIIDAMRKKDGTLA